MAGGHGTELLELAEALDVPGHRGAGGPGRQLGHGLPHPSAGPGARRGRAQPQAAGVKGTLRPLARRHAAFAAPLPAVSEASQPITVRGRKATKAHGPGSNETPPRAAARAKPPPHGALQLHALARAAAVLSTLRHPLHPHWVPGEHRRHHRSGESAATGGEPAGPPWASHNPSTSQEPAAAGGAAARAPLGSRGREFREKPA